MVSKVARAPGLEGLVPMLQTSMDYGNHLSLLPNLMVLEKKRKFTYYVF